MRQHKAYEYFSCGIPSRGEDRTRGKLASADTYARVVICGQAETRIRRAALTNEFVPSSQRALGDRPCWQRRESSVPLVKRKSYKEFPWEGGEAKKPREIEEMTEEVLQAA